MDREKEEEMTERKHGMKVGKRNEKILYIYTNKVTAQNFDFSFRNLY